MGESGAEIILKKTTDGARWLISFSRSRSRRTRGERSRTETGKPRSRHTSSIRRETSNFFFGRLIVAGDNDVHRQPAQGLAQQLGGVLFDPDDVAKVAQVLKGTVLSFAAVAVLSDTID